MLFYFLKSYQSSIDWRFIHSKTYGLLLHVAKIVVRITYLHIQTLLVCGGVCSRTHECIFQYSLIHSAGFPYGHLYMPSLRALSGRVVLTVSSDSPCLRGSPPTKYLLCRTGFVAWRLRRPNRGMPMGSSFFLWRPHMIWFVHGSTQ